MLELTLDVVNKLKGQVLINADHLVCHSRTINI